MRKLKKAAIAVASTAALTLGTLGLAAPANADDVGALATVGIAYNLPNFNGTTGTLTDVGGTCTDIPSMSDARSVENTSSDHFILLYVDAACTDLAPIQLDSGESIAVTNVVSYRAIPE